MRIIACSSSKRNSANARASSVFPTPVGPRKMKLPIGRCGSFNPERARITASATAVTASSCPITRLCNSSSRCSSFCISPSSSLVTGTPVQRLTTWAMSSSSTSSLISFDCACCFAKASDSRATSRSSAASLPYFNSATRFRSYCLSACSISSLVCSTCSRSPRKRCTAPFSACQRAVNASDSAFRFASSFSSLPRRSRDTASVSLRSASRSISSCMIRRRVSSSSAGIESISVRSRAAASSTRSIALSGRNRSVI